MCFVEINVEEYLGMILTPHLLPEPAAPGLEGLGSCSLEMTLWVSRKTLTGMNECPRDEWRNSCQEKNAEEWKKY